VAPTGKPGTPDRCPAPASTLVGTPHYAHIGAIPHLRGAWPAVKVLGAEHAAYVFTRSRALQTIRALGAQAAAIFRAGELPPYDDALLKIDAVVGEGDKLDLGGLGVTVHATPGHTRCSLSFLVGGGLRRAPRGMPPH